MTEQLNWMLGRAKAGKMSRREFLGRTTALGVSTALASALFTKAAHAEPKKGGTIRVGIVGGESSEILDPGRALTPYTFAANRAWGEGLTDITADGAVEMRVAEEISSSPDLKTWTVKIRSGLEFHNGKAVTAEDVVATYLRHTDEKAQSGALGIVKGIKEMKAEGDKVVFTLEEGNADLPYLLSAYQLPIQPGGGVDDPNAGIGCGPYKLEYFEAGVRMGYTKYENYFDTSIGHAAEVEMLAINDNTARTAALTSGQVHMINRVDPKIAELLKNAPGVSIKRAAGRGHFIFIMHCDKAPFDNNDLRMALKMSIKRQEMVDKILGGLGQIGNDIPINSSYPLFDETIPQREYDAAAAAEFYKKSGHDGSPIILQTAPGAFPGAVDAANLFAASANAAGIPLTVQVEPDDGYWTNVWNVQPFCASYWGGRPVQDSMYSTAYTSNADWNDTRFKNATFDELIAAARGEIDATKRKEQYSKAAYLVRDEGGLILPMFNEWVEGVRDDIGGWYEDPVQELMNGRAIAKCWLV